VGNEPAERPGYAGDRRRCRQTGCEAER
jgi:hypothetical protein